MIFIRKFAVLALLFIIVLPITSLADSVPLKGIYSLMKGLDIVNPSILNLPFVSGVSIRASWDVLEPEEGKFDWSYLDNALYEVKKANKKAMIRILPGVRSPKWVYGKDVTTVEVTGAGTYLKKYGKSFIAPVPWNENYLKAWTKFVYALGERYSMADTVVLVHITGPNVRSAEMHLPKQGDERALMMKAGYSKNRIVSAWKTVIDAFANAFPKKSLALNMAIPLKNDHAMEDIIQYGISKLGQRLYIQGNFLSAYTRDSFHTYEVIFNLKKNNYVNVGFQMLGASDESRMGNLTGAVQKGLDAGASYFEIYEKDVTIDRNRQLLMELDKRLKR